MNAIDYSGIHRSVELFLQTRDGLNNSKNKKMFNVFLKELTGILCGIAYDNYIHSNEVKRFLTAVKRHKMGSFNDDGQLHEVSELISKRILEDPLYNLLEYTLMNYKPGNVQVGPGEMFFCFYNSDSTFGIDNTNGFDIIVDDKKTELKKLGTNFTNEELFDKYAADKNCERLLVVKPVSDAKVPLLRSSYACITFEDKNWREAFDHIGKQGTLVLKEH